MAAIVCQVFPVLRSTWRLDTGIFLDDGVLLDTIL